MELVRWLNAIDPALAPAGLDNRLRTIGRAATSIQAAFAESQRRPPRAQMLGDATGRIFVAWSQPPHTTEPWRGVVISADRAQAMFTATLGPLLEGEPFRAALRDRTSVLWGEVPDLTQARATALESIPEWTLTFSDAIESRATTADRVLNYARIAFPILVLACGLVMTAWIVRRELALAELQSTFVAAVTHEFKSPITSVRLLLERITGGRIAAGDSPQRYYTAIAQETDRLDSLVNRLLEAQKLQSGRKDVTRSDRRPSMPSCEKSWTACARKPTRGRSRWACEPKGRFHRWPSTPSQCPTPSAICSTTRSVLARAGTRGRLARRQRWSRRADGGR